MSPFIQNLIAAGIGLIALAYLCKRWWPSWLALFKPSSGAGCGSTSDAGSSCGSGCGSCGSSSQNASKDHRIQIIKRPPSAP